MIDFHPAVGGGAGGGIVPWADTVILKPEGKRRWANFLGVLFVEALGLLPAVLSRTDRLSAVSQRLTKSLCSSVPAWDS